MNGTPRLRSSYPQTPQASARRTPNETPRSSSKLASSLPTAPAATGSDVDTAPFIPFDVIDAPTQRFYAICLYGLLMAWRFYDWTTLMAEDTESLWNFLKWTAIDAVFLFGLPIFRIPWVEWSTFTTSILWFSHAAFNVMLMFRIGIPVNLWIAGLVKVVYDKELAINERNVKPADVIRNASVILGKHIVTILPEGSAVLNPENEPFCLGGSIHSINLPININQTRPILMELSHLDIATNQEDIITLSSSNIKKMVKEATKHQKNKDNNAAVVLRYQVKKPGLYRLARVIDESKLEVHTGASEAYVVNCPEARFVPTKQDRCKGDQSDVALEVDGTPPLKVTYRKVVNGNPREVAIQSIQPEDFVTPIQKHTGSALVKVDETDYSWAKSRTISVPLTETLRDSGRYAYAIDEVQDGFGNVVPFRSQADIDEGRSKDSKLFQSLIVHERPRVLLRDCDQRPLQVAKGYSTRLPVILHSTGKGAITNSPYTIEYQFTAEDELSPAGDHKNSPVVQRVVLKNEQSPISIQHAGLYTLKSVSTGFCEGEVLEPASCLLQNPIKPQVSFSQENIFDKCAGNPIGLRINLDLVGTPPFTVRYMERPNDKVLSKHIHGLRGQIVLTPEKAGHYTYKFLDVSDAVYRNLGLKEEFQQDVKPSASAHFVDRGMVKEACIDAPVQYNVRLVGEGPWTLEYELVHGGKRLKKKVEKIETELYTIQTDKLKSGGDYSILLTGVMDRMGCKEFLKEEAHFKVRGERPKAYFGQIEGKRSTRMLEGKRVQLPIRLTGKPRWTVTYRNINEPGSQRIELMSNSNSNLDITSEGTYELVDVRDDFCPGTIDESGKQFVVSWVPRPQVSIPEGPTMKAVKEGKFVKDAVCEGDVDSFEIAFTGTPPYSVKYSESFNFDNGQKGTKGAPSINAAMNTATIEADTAKAGLYQYEFTQISDVNYDHDKRKHSPLSVEQRVFPRPNARFASPGKTYPFCSREEDGEEVIPLTLEGIPPFTIEISIKHHSSRPGQPRAMTIPGIGSTKHDLRIPHRLLELGNSIIAIRKVRDSRGCERTLDTTSNRVQISVYDAPIITAVESRTDYCVGERLAYTLSGKVPFSVFYTFNGQARKATSHETTFRRLAELPGTFEVTGVSDSASQCKASTNLSATVHPMPSVRISKGKSERVSIREGGETDILFEFTGTPPFEVTYTRSTNERPGHRSKILETKVVFSEEYSTTVKANEEGTYEAVALKDKWCAYPSPADSPQHSKGQKLLQF